MYTGNVERAGDRKMRVFSVYRQCISRVGDCQRRVSSV